MLFITYPATAADFDCGRVKSWPNYGGDANGWAIEYCKQLVGVSHHAESAFKSLEEYRTHRKLAQGQAAKSFQQLLANANALANRAFELERKWTNPLSKLHQDVSNFIRSKWQLCATPWECTVTVFGTTEAAMLCGGPNCKEVERFRLTYEELYHLLGIVVAGIKSKGIINPEVQATLNEFQKTLVEVQDQRTAAKIAILEYENYNNTQVRNGAVSLLEEYVAMFGN